MPNPQSIGLATAIITGNACNMACWMAEEDVCRCSCGGVNHGIMKRGGDRPARASRIDGHLYTLASVEQGTLCEQAEAINKAAGPVQKLYGYTYGWRDTDPGAPARVKPPTDAQMKWPEVAAIPKDPRHPWWKPYLLWVRQDMEVK